MKGGNALIRWLSELLLLIGASAQKEAWWWRSDSAGADRDKNKLAHASVQGAYMSLHLKMFPQTLGVDETPSDLLFYK